MTPVTIRAIGSGELEDFMRSMSGPFAFDLPDDDADRANLLQRFGAVFEPERTRCAFDGDTMVGTLGVFSLDLTVPAGRVRCSGTTMVTVAASHRRRGVLRTMMEAHLEEARSHGDPVAGLWASDSAIYGRFGFGLAAQDARVEISRRHVDLHRLAPEPATARFVDAEAAAELLPRIYGRVLPTRPGMYGRSPVWWELRRLRDTPDRRNGATAFRFAVTEGEDGTPTGYVQYRVKSDWDDLHGAHEVRVVELMATSPEAAAGLWSVVLSHDLAKTIKAELRPVDDPLFDLLAARRRAAPQITDSLWIRILDVPAALTARGYSAPGDVVIGAVDPLDGAASRYRLVVDADGTARCGVTEAEPDVELDLEDLGGAYLGWARFRRLAAAGRLRGRDEALATLDRMFTWDPAPWCPEVF